MELAASIEPFICPLAAFLDPNDNDFFRSRQTEYEELTSENQSAVVWASSVFNPRNRLNAFYPREDHPWRVDGCAAMGRQLFVTPTFLLPGLPVKCIDVIIPCQSKHPNGLRRMLRSSALYGMSSASIRQLEIVQYVEQVLSRWSSKLPYFNEIYQALPFGSRMVIEAIVPEIDNAKVRFVPNVGFTERLVPLDALYGLWTTPSNFWPTAINLEDLRHVSHLNSNVSIVQLPQRNSSELLVLKTNLRETDAIYHELRLLLTMDAHPNIITKPRYIVTVEDHGVPSCRVMGFILEYYASGTLRDALESDSQPPWSTKVRWAKQIVRTMRVILEGPAQFYSDLKPDNLMLSQDGLDVIFIDFEQAGTWDTFLAPEIFYLQWMETLSRDPSVSQIQREQYESLLRTTRKHLTRKEEALLRPTHAFRDAWVSLSAQQREQAMVFSVGKMLWCIFEGVSHTRNSTDEKYEQETSIEFPDFSQTPEYLRSLIRQCTLGAPEWRSKEECRIVRDELSFIAVPISSACLIDGRTPRGAMHAAKRLWTYRVQQMQDFMEARSRWLAGNPLEGDDVLLGFHSRPSLADVLSVLEDETRDGEGGERNSSTPQ